jgi:amino acid transporter
MATEAVPTVTRPTDVGLKREMGLIGAIWASEGSIIGSGWLFGALLAVQLAGTAGILAWVIVGAIFAVLALVHSELGAMYPVAGGSARFPHLAFGSVAGTSFGFFAWVQALTVAPIECFAVMEYASYWWKSVYNPSTGVTTGLGYGMAVILMAIFTAINFFGIRWLSYSNSTVTWWKIAIPLLAIIGLLTQWHSSSFNVGGFAPFGVKGVFEAMVGAGVAFALLGFEQADQLAGEVKNPQRIIPRAIIGAMALGTLIYVGLQVAFIAALKPSLLTHGVGGLACPPAPAHCATNIALLNAGPFAALAGFVGLGWLALILRIDAVVSPGGTGLIYTTSTSRVGYGLARNRYFPQFFAKTDSRGVPWVSLILTFVLGLFFLLPFPSWKALVGLVTGASVLMYAGAPLALGALRRQMPDVDRPYRIPGAVVVAPLAFILANIIIYFSGFTVIWKLGVVLVIGYALIGIFMAFDKHRPPLDWKSAQWLPVYLIGMGIISWQGQYSGESSTAPPLNTGNIGLWYDIGLVTAFSLVIYYWAQAVRLPREEVLDLVSRQTGVEPPERS